MKQFFLNEQVNLKPVLLFKDKMSGIMTLKPKVLDGKVFAMYKLYGGLDVQAGGLYHLGDRRAI